MTHDEANHGREAIGILAGELRLFFPLNYGSEPLYSYTVALSMALFGRGLIIGDVAGGVIVDEGVDLVAGQLAAVSPAASPASRPRSRRTRRKVMMVVPPVLVSSW